MRTFIYLITVLLFILNFTPEIVYFFIHSSDIFTVHILYGIMDVVFVGGILNTNSVVRALG